MHTARRADKDHHGLLTNAAPEGPREWPHLSHGPLSAVDSTCCPLSARPPSLCSPPVKDGPLPWRPELSVSATARSLAWATQQGPRWASVAAWLHPPSLAAAWAVLSEEDEVAATGATTQPARERRTAPGPGEHGPSGSEEASPRPPDCANHFYFRTLSVYPIDQRAKSILTWTRPHRQSPWVRRGDAGAETCRRPRWDAEGGPSTGVTSTNTAGRTERGRACGGHHGSPAGPGQ